MKNRTGNRGGREGGCLNTTTGATGQSHRHGSAMATPMLRVTAAYMGAEAGFRLPVQEIPVLVKRVDANPAFANIPAPEDRWNHVLGNLVLLLLTNKHLDDDGAANTAALTMWLIHNSQAGLLVADGVYARCWIDITPPAPEERGFQLHFSADYADPFGASETTVH